MATTSRAVRPGRVDWAEVTRLMAEADVGTPFLIGRYHRSVATRINDGMYAQVDPAVFFAWTANYRRGEDTSEIWMRRQK